MAFVLAFLATAAGHVVGIIQRIAQISALVIIVSVLGLMFWIFAAGKAPEGKYFPYIMGGIALAVIAAYSLEAWKFITLNLSDFVVLPLALMLAAAFAVIGYVFAEEEKGSTPPPSTS